MIDLIPAPPTVAFDDWYATDWTRLVAFGIALTSDRGAAEDLAQEACAAVYRDWDRIENPEGYARRAMTNRAASRWRRNGREQNALRRLRAVDDAVAAAPSVPTDEFWRAVRALPYPQGQVVALHYLEDRSVAEIARLLEIAEGTVKAALHRGRKALAISLGHFTEELA